MKLGYAVLMAAVGAMLMFAPAAMGADKAEKAHDKNVAYGEVKAVGADSITIAVRKKDAAAEDKTIATTGDTKVVIASKSAEGKIEEKAGTMADVKVGAHVRVTLGEAGKAVKIVVMPSRGEHKGGHEKAPAK